MKTRAKSCFTFLIWTPARLFDKIQELATEDEIRSVRFDLGEDWRIPTCWTRLPEYVLVRVGEKLVVFRYAHEPLARTELYYGNEGRRINSSVLLGIANKVSESEECICTSLVHYGNVFATA